MTPVTHTAWPLWDLRLTIDDLVLRPTTEADLPAIAALLPADVELDPALPGFPGGDLAADRGARIYQGYWRGLASGRPGSWNQLFIVERAGFILGEQTLEAKDFATLRTVETASWLVTEARGVGIGKLMRLAVLALAFEGLGALVAETEAWHHNAASLGVSRSVGYLPNGVYRHSTATGADDMVRMRMPVERWRELHTGAPVEISGLQPCLPYLLGEGPPA